MLILSDEKGKMLIDMDEIRELKKKIFLTAYKAGSAHLASAFSVIDVLYFVK